MSARGSVRAAYWVWRSELHALVRAPLLYVLGGGFLTIQGIAFAGLVRALSDPRRPAPLGELLEGQLAGTLLTWVLGLVVLALLGMRAIAEDRRSGAWEQLLTAQVSEGAAVIGKWLAAATVYLLLWVPTLAYFGVVAMFRSDDGGWDVRAIACGYVGAIAIGAALLAWAIAASAATGSVLAAGALAFALLLGWFLVGELPALAPDLAVDHPALATALAALSVRGTVLQLARGDVALSGLVFIGGLGAVGLSLATTLACAGRRRRGEVRARGTGTFGIAIVAALALALAVRHPVHRDVSARGRNTLDAATLETLALVTASGQPASLTIVEPTLAGLVPVYDEIALVASRMAAATGGSAAVLSVRRTDPATAPGGIAAIAREAGLASANLEQGGAVIVAVGARRQVVDVMALATIGLDPHDAPVVEQLGVEQALAGALGALARTEPIEVCASTGHGELSLAALPTPAPGAAADPAGGATWSLVGSRLRAGGLTVVEVDVESGPVPRTCRVLLVAGPTTPLAPGAALAVQAYLRTGGAVLVAAASRAVPGATEPGGLVPTGLEAILAADGLGIPAAIAVDPALGIRELPGALLIVDGYAAHPITAGFARTRATLWYQPRPVLVERGALALVSATPTSWGETDVSSGAPPARQASDLAGPVAVAALGRSGRVIALGSAESLTTTLLAGGASAADRFLDRAVRFLAGALPVPVAPTHAPTQVRLVLTASQRAWIVRFSTGGIPLLWLVVGGGILLWRRRRAEASA